MLPFIPLLVALHGTPVPPADKVEVTTLTLSAGGTGVPCSATSRGMNGSMSVGLVFVWSDGPDGLEGEIAGRRATSDLGPRVLRSKLDPLAFPQGQRRNHLPNDQSGIGPLHVVVA